MSTVQEKVQAVADTATSALETGTHHAGDVASAAKHAAANAASSVRATITATTEPRAAPSAPAATKARAATPVPMTEWTDDFLHRAVSAQQKKVNDLPPGAERDAARGELDAMRAEAHARFAAHEHEAPAGENAAPPPEKTWGEIVRPAGAFLAGVGTERAPAAS